MFETSEFILWSFTENKISESERKKKQNKKIYFAWQIDITCSLIAWFTRMSSEIASSFHRPFKFVVPSSFSAYQNLFAYQKKKKTIFILQRFSTTLI